MNTTIQLNQSDVKFLPVEHEYYTPDGIQLSGVTTLLKKHIFKDMYKGVKQEYLDAAIDRGHKVHSDVETIDLLGFDPVTEEGRQYLNLRKEFTPVANEYLVSNNVNIASCIDCVWADNEGNIFLADIKTTSELKLHYLEWQLSIYAYLFELQNPELKVSGLYAVWLPYEKYGNPTLRLINRISDAEVEKLINCDMLGVEYEEPAYLTMVNNLPVEYQDLEAALVNIVEMKKQAEAKEKEFKERMLELMMQHNVKKWESERISITLKDAYEKESFDSKSFKTDYPELNAQYTKKSMVKESLLVKVK